jgi:helicase MOV-10
MLTNVPENSFRQVLSYSYSKGELFDIPPLQRLHSYRVILSTCITSIRLSLQGEGIPAGHFTHIFIDEFGQATEPEGIIPISTLMKIDPSSSANTRVVVAGDPKQLGPIIHSPEAKKRGLAISMLERLTENIPLYRKNNASHPFSGGYNPRFITKLLHNYRNHPDILRIPSQLFYDKELISSGDIVLLNSMIGWE